MMLKRRDASSWTQIFQPRTATLNLRTVSTVYKHITHCTFTYLYSPSFVALRPVCSAVPVFPVIRLHELDFAIGDPWLT